MAERIPGLFLEPETAFFILLKAREFHAKMDEVDTDEGSNPTDDKMIDLLEFQADGSGEEELISAIQGLDEDERLDLIALIWIGRGDFSPQQWSEARENAPADRPTGRRRLCPGPAHGQPLPAGGPLADGHSLIEFLDRGFSEIGDVRLLD